MKAANLKHGITITLNEVMNLMSELGIKVYTFIDSETKFEFLQLTGFTLTTHDSCETYEVSEY